MTSREYDLAETIVSTYTQLRGIERASAIREIELIVAQHLGAAIARDRWDRPYPDSYYDD